MVYSKGWSLGKVNHSNYSLRKNLSGIFGLIILVIKYENEYRIGGYNRRLTEH